MTGSRTGRGNIQQEQEILHCQKVSVTLLSHVRLFATPWTVASQAPPPMGFFRQEYWSGLVFPSPGDLPDPGIKPGSPVLQADALPSEPPGKPRKPESKDVLKTNKQTNQNDDSLPKG